MGIVSLILIAGSLVLMFFVVLSGFNSTTPLNKTYFLRADTSAVSGARPISQWTYFYVCGADNTDCGRPVPDLPIGYAWIGGGEGAPASLIGYVTMDSFCIFEANAHVTARAAKAQPAPITTFCGGSAGSFTLLL